MPFREEWTRAPQALTIEALFAQGHASYFLHDNLIYVGFLQPEPVPKGQNLWYKAIARDTGRPTTFLGATVVTPVTCTRATFIDPH
jgi:hypothetical protein